MKANLDMDIDSSHLHSSGPSNFKNLILLSLAALFNITQHITADSIYTWLFRILSLISLIIVIYINLHKAKDFYKRNKKPRKHGKA